MNPVPEVRQFVVALVVVLLLAVPLSVLLERAGDRLIRWLHRTR